ncbi:MAG: acyl-CoA mutase large subunit family protein [Acidobacteriota bacterium]
MENPGKKIKLDRNIDLKGDFSIPTINEWQAVAEGSLKGVPFEKALINETDEGIKLKPVYLRDDIREIYENNNYPGTGDFVRGIEKDGFLTKGWDICQRTGAGFPDEFNQYLIEDLSYGQTSILVNVDAATGKCIDPSSSVPGEVAKNGLSITTIDDMKNMFRNIELKNFPVIFEAADSALELFMMFNEYCKEKNIDISTLSGALNFDPVESLAKTGTLSAPLKYLYDNMSMALKWGEQNIPYFKVIGASTLPYHNSGASAVQEIAIALSTGVNYIDEMKKRGISINSITGSMVFRFGIGPDFFMEVAKLRTARVLWSKIVEAYGGNEENRKMFIHGETSTYNQTKYDPYVNMLRTTTESFSALAGGINRLTTNTFDQVFGSSETFSRRNARNIQMILKEESHLDKIIDPAAGSYYVEKLTDEVKRKSWEFFLEIEENGGIKKGLESGFIRREVKDTAKKHQEKLSKGKRVLIGTNKFSNINEKKVNYSGPGDKELIRRRVKVIDNFKKDPERPELKKRFDEVSSVLKKDSVEIFEFGSSLFSSGATLQEVREAFLKTGSLQKEKIDKMEIKRLAFEFEKIRERVWSYNSSEGEELTITIAVAGPPGKIKPRIDFCRSFFEVAGIRGNIIELKGNSEEMFVQLTESRPKMIALCAPDGFYPELIPELVPLLKGKAEEPVLIMAGNPGDKRKEFENMGIKFFIYLGADIAHTITQILNESGVKNG